MKVRTIYRWTNFVLLLLIGVFAYLAFLSNAMHQKSQEYMLKYEECRLIAEEMQNSSDRLTMMARLYLVSGDPKYKAYYYQILAIRQGTAPRPHDYDSTYWDRVLAGSETILLQGEAESFLARLQRLGFNEQEISLLRLSEMRSQELVKLEEKAFARWEEGYAGADKAERIKLEEAREILNSAAYLEGKEAIMEPIDRFIRFSEERLREKIKELEDKEGFYLQAILLLTGVAGVVLLALRLLTERFLLEPLALLVKQVKRISEGDLNIRSCLRERNEMGELGRALDEMLDALEKERRQMAEMSRVDGLTGIANRRRFDEYFQVVWEMARREKKPLALIMIDIDYFKLYNDRYGHPAGDECLIRVAKALTDSLPRKVDLIARYGGEEFACLLPGTCAEAALTVAERLRENVFSLWIEHADSQAAAVVSISLGVASLLPQVDFNPELLLQAADRALYEAKENGRNKVRLAEAERMKIIAKHD